MSADGYGLWLLRTYGLWGQVWVKRGLTVMLIGIVIALSMMLLT